MTDNEPSFGMNPALRQAFDLLEAAKAAFLHASSESDKNSPGLIKLAQDRVHSLNDPAASPAHTNEVAELERELQNFNFGHR
jgi:hypothetical protein